MEVRSQTVEFIRDLERSSNHKLFYPSEVGQLLDCARQYGMMKEFEDAIFFAKFITRSMIVMKRIGPDGDGFDKLSSEVESSIQKASELLKKIIVAFSEEAARIHLLSFFSMSHEALDRLMNLFSDLTLVKNRILDKNPLP